MAVTTPAAMPKPTTLKAQNSAEGGAITLSPQNSELATPDALSVLTHLYARGLLCSSCGYRWAVVENAAYLHCVECQRPNMTYNPRLGKGSDFEQLLCKRLGQWVTAFLKADQAASANATNSKSK